MNTPPGISGELILLEKLLPNVPRGTIYDLVRYADLVLSWNKKMNLTGATSLHEFVELHVADSLAALNLMAEEGGVIDVGSGAGLPGLVWAIARPKLMVVLVESLQKRSSFLEKAKAELILNNVQIFPKRFETVKETELPQITHRWNVVSRGTAAPRDLLKLARNSLVDWNKWYVFSNDKIHAEYLKEASSLNVKIVKGDYSKYLPQGMKSRGLLTCLHRLRE